MDKVARLSDKDRRELFESTASTMGLHPAIIEKDFWVCWTLRKLFTSPLLGENLVFKGGTSLSKVHRLIERFSEDIDLVLNWELLEYGVSGRDPWEEQPSNTQQDRLCREVNAKAAKYLKNVFHPHLANLFASTPAMTASVSKREALTINIRYPAAFELTALRPDVKLEIGPLASWMPSDKHIIRPYAAEAYPAVFEDPDCPVRAIRAERSFWEKATILHQQAHRETNMPPSYSRHYYDLAQMAKSPVKASALADLELLEDVVLFKMRFYRSAWAHYEEAKPGTFRLLPKTQVAQALEADYEKMKAMFFHAPPDWDVILSTLRALEEEINKNG